MSSGPISIPPRVPRQDPLRTTLSARAFFKMNRSFYIALLLFALAILASAVPLGREDLNLQLEGPYHELKGSKDHQLERRLFFGGSSSSKKSEKSGSSKGGFFSKLKSGLSKVKVCSQS